MALALGWTLGFTTPAQASQQASGEETPPADRAQAPAQSSAQTTVQSSGVASTPTGTPAHQWPTCPVDRTYCFGLHLWLDATKKSNRAILTWATQQIDEANRLFAPVSIGFCVAKVGDFDPALQDVADAAHRDRLSEVHQLEPGLIAVFLPSRLADIDVLGAEIRGVHWRHRSGNKVHYVVVSQIAQPLVLAHELGHYFGLAHATEAASIMNKRPREQPPMSARGFVAREQKIILRLAQGYVERRELQVKRPIQAAVKASVSRPE